MAYSDFSLAKVKKSFDLTLDETRNLFVDTKPVTPSETLRTILIDYIPLATAISTEKARSEFLIAPILAEVSPFGEVKSQKSKVKHFEPHK
ncbi:hypothetical protein [uncultured Nostoc sp.]|uniref:hypothetical protein n=1 Tax=uncultured Nostoc sp. TaxID=340711 RepID=UPI0035CA92BB